MEKSAMTSEEYDNFLAESFWPAFWKWWRKKIFGSTLLTVRKSFGYWRQSFEQWREEETDSIGWFFRSFFKGFNLHFCAAMALGMFFAEVSFFLTLAHYFDVRAKELIEPLYWALPALIGTTMLDYLLEAKKRPTVALISIVTLGGLGFLAYCFHLCEPTVNKFYLITLGVLYFVWCIKACDSRMTNNERNSASVLPGPINLLPTDSSPSTLKSGGKTMILKRPGEEAR